MLSLIGVSNQVSGFPYGVSNLNFHQSPCPRLEFNFRGGVSFRRESHLVLHFVLVKELVRDFCSSFVVVHPRRRKFSYSGQGLLRKCRTSWGGEGDAALEGEILEFMKNSNNPQAFPTKEQLIEAGRLDLVAGIVREGGWLASGWDLDKEEGELEINTLPNGERVIGHGNGASLWASTKKEMKESKKLRGIASEDYNGIEGILNRLENERNESFGFNLKEKMIVNHSSPNELSVGSPAVNATAAFANNVEVSALKFKDSMLDDIWKSENLPYRVENHVKLYKQDTWRAWSIKRAGSSDMDFEAGDINYEEIRTGSNDTADDKNTGRDVGCSNMIPTDETMLTTSINHDSIKGRLQNLEVELSSVLQTLKSHADASLLKNASKETKNSPEDLLKLSDAWEFQENEIISAQDKLRSIRAKLAVLEGKMALAIVDAQKLMEVKQKRIDDARRALSLLRTACIVWPNSASEVLLAGSFDGWVSQRKMEKSKTGIFSLYMKLYPGRYEIKFIVDGEWKIDPLRPIVRNNGYENNLLIIS